MAVDELMKISHGKHIMRYAHIPRIFHSKFFMSTNIASLFNLFLSNYGFGNKQVGKCTKILNFKFLIVHDFKMNYLILLS